MENNSVIHGSSYLVYEGSLTKNSPINCVPGQVSKDSKIVTFYTFDGNSITTIEHRFDFEGMNAKLDKFALPPKPISYRRVWVPSFKFDKNSPHVEAGYLVLFHDKNGNRIAWEVLNSENEYINSWLEYDLSQAFEEESDYSLKNTIGGIDIIESYVSGSDTNYIPEVSSIPEKENYQLDETQINFCRKSVICSNPLSSSVSGDLTMSIMRISDVSLVETVDEHIDKENARAYLCVIF